MKAIIVDQLGGELKIGDVPVPEPAEGQILVKVVCTAINPVDGLTINTGLLVEEWPFIPGCDIGGEVIKVGKNAISPLGKAFEVGDRVCGCTAVGRNKFATYQEQALMLACVTLPVPKSLSCAEAATIGVGFYTAGLAVFGDLNVPIPNPQELPAAKDEWALILGGASSVGKAAAQLLKICGYKVIVTASPRSKEALTPIGVDAIVDYKQSEPEIIKEIISITEGKLYRIFDAVAQNIAISVPIFKEISGTDKWFTSTNDWEPLPETNDFHASAVSLGPISRPDADALNSQIRDMIPFLAEMLKIGRIIPAEIDLVGGTGLEAVLEAYAHQSAGKGGNKKVVAKVQDE